MSFDNQSLMDYIGGILELKGNTGQQVGEIASIVLSKRDQLKITFIWFGQRNPENQAWSKTKPRPIEINLNHQPPKASGQFSQPHWTFQDIFGNQIKLSHPKYSRMWKDRANNWPTH